MKFSKVYSFLNRIVTIKEKVAESDLIKYGTNNLFPQELIRYISESGTATSCVDILNQYIFAEGLVNENLGSFKVNKTQTLNQLIKKTVPYVSNFQGLAWHIIRSANGKVAEIECIPFEYIRKKGDGTLVYNPTFSLTNKFEEKLNEVYPPFRGKEINSSDLAEHIVKYGSDKGEILYFFIEKPCQYIYPIPTYHSAISDIETDAENSKYELESVNNSFLPSGIMTLVGEVDDTNEDEKGKTERDYIEDTLSQFTGNEKDQTGESGRQKLLVLHAKSKDEIPNYQQINNEGILTAIELSTKRVAEKVARAFGVPPFLIGLGGNVGFATNIISDNITLFNNRVLILQDIITEALELTLPENDYSLTQLTPLKYIAPEIYSKLTDAELRELAGYETDENKTQTTISLAQTLGVGSTTSFIEILKDPLLQEEQKINALVILFNLPKEQAELLLKTNDVQTTNN